MAVSAALPVELLDDGTELMTGEAVGLDIRPTGFVLRAAGAIIDALVSVALVVLVLLGLNSPLLAPLFDDASRAAVSVAALVFSLVVFPTAIETATQGKSIGRLAVGARIVRDDGGSIGLRHAFIRALTGVIEIFSTVGGIAAMTALLNSRSKRLGDLLAGTYSQNERPPRLVPNSWGMPPTLLQWSLTADAARMPDPLTRRIAQFLGQAGRFTPGARERLANELASEAARWVSPVPASSPEVFLAAVTVLRREREARALKLAQERMTALEPVLRGLPHAFPDRG
jgi:uncharacterized RDD family membrane protein YckC